MEKPRARASAGWIMAILLAGAGARVVFFAGAWDSIYLRHPMVDAATYHEWAARILAGDRFEHAYWQPPLYPLFLALEYAILGVDPRAAAVLQSGLGLAALVLLFLAGRSAVGLRAAGAGCLLAAVNPVILFYEANLVSNVLEELLVYAGLLVAVTLGRRDRPGSWLAVGLLCGTAALARPNALSLALALTLTTLTAAGDRARRRPVRQLLPLWVGVVLVLAAGGLRNTLAGGVFTPISTNGWVNLYLGNHPDSGELLQIRPGGRWDWLMRQPRLAAGESSPAIDSAYFARELGRGLRERPLALVPLWLSKLRQLLSGYEHPRNENLYHLRQHIPYLRWSLWQRGGFFFPQGLLLPLGIAGLVAVRRRNPSARLLVNFTLVYAVSILAFFVCARYRALLLGPLSLGAAALADHLRAGSNRGRAAAAAVALVVAGLATNLVLPVTVEGFGYSEFQMGRLLQEEGDLAGAERQYRLAIQLDPELSDPHSLLGMLLLQSDRYAESETCLRRALELHPEEATARFRLALLLLRRGPHAECLEEALRAVRSEPVLQETYVVLVWLSEHVYPLRQILAAMAARVDPVLHWQAYRGLAYELARLGKPGQAAVVQTVWLSQATHTEMAAAQLRELLDHPLASVLVLDEARRLAAQEPDWAPVQLLAARLFLDQGRPDLARPYLAAAAAAAPDSARVARVLAATSAAGE